MKTKSPAATSKSMFLSWRAGGGVGNRGSVKELALLFSLEDWLDSASFLALPLTLGGV